MKFSLFLSTLLVFGVSVSTQINSATNGLNVPAGANPIQLGGSLIQSTNIDLNGSGLYFKNNGGDILCFLNNVNIGIGTAYPAARLSFPDIFANDNFIGISWYGASPIAYGIHHTAGNRASPNFLQLCLGATEIILDPGVEFGKAMWIFRVMACGLRKVK
jgi:hypothetical protein